MSKRINLPHSCLPMYLTTESERSEDRSFRGFVSEQRDGEWYCNYNLLYPVALLPDDLAEAYQEAPNNHESPDWEFVEFEGYKAAMTSNKMFCDYKSLDYPVADLPEDLLHEFNVADLGDDYIKFGDHFARRIGRDVLLCDYLSVCTCDVWISGCTCGVFKREQDARS